ncbi:MAG TPA: family 1 glycosylhydrolase [Gemmatimonadaceae bacterium]|nr:family 1 glycosylhydrolase [Gemmatimonadaceae bacterium]
MTRVGSVDVWAGIECTNNRVGEHYYDQVRRSGHCDRPADIALIASLGIRTVRYPVLWERTAPERADRYDWNWADARLNDLRAHGIEPVVGLLHHGSGPRYTSLLDDDFPAAFARYARAVAERYPWVQRWTPINEPLTTARFSTLYGHWYPHLRDDAAFARAIVRQCRAIALAMRAIRQVIPDALLVQTEDLGKAYATARLQYQADFENARRWLTFDLLCGRVDERHPMWTFLGQAPDVRHELAELATEPCTPDLFGINHYVTSERFLDERLEHYPVSTHGGNAREAYADVEAARVLIEGIGGPRAALAAAWERYNKPVAITEAHLAGTREQQLRWLHEVWSAANEQKALGADVRAITVWSLFGAYDWHNLATRVDGQYEPGAFDIRAPRPRATAIARLARDLCATGCANHAVLSEPGWWRRDERLLRSVSLESRRDAPSAGSTKRARPLLITGATGTLGRAFAHICEERQLAHALTTRHELEISQPGCVARVLDQVQPWAVINAAGYVRVDDAERHPDACDRDNYVGPSVLADACATRDIALVTFSSDLVFAGDKTTPYVESDCVKPLGAYGSSKAAAETVVLQRLPTALVIRTSAFFGPWDVHNFAARVVRALAAGETIQAACDQVVSPTYVPDLVHATLDLLIDGESGIWHLANTGAITWAQLAQRVASLMGLDERRVTACSTSSLNLIAARPPYSVLGSERAALLPSLDDALDRFARVQRVEEPATLIAA